MIFPASQESALPSKPGKEPLNQPPSAVAAKLSSILSLVLAAIFAMRSYHLNAIFGEFFIKGIAVVCLVSNQLFRLCFDHIEIKRQLYQSYFMMVRCVHGHRDGQAVTVHNST